MNKRFLSWVMFAQLVAQPLVAAENYSMVKGPQTSRPIAVYLAPSETALSERKIPLDEFRALGAQPVLEEKGSFIRIKDKDDQSIWILSEKVELARAINCGDPTPESVVKVVKNETIAARGIGEACGRKGK